MVTKLTFMNLHPWIFLTNTAAQCGTRIWRTETQNTEDPECGSWVSSHIVTKRKLRPKIRSTSRFIEFLGAYRDFCFSPRKMIGLISQARCHSRILANPIYMRGCKSVYQERVLEPRDRANFAQVMAPNERQLQGYLTYTKMHPPRTPP